MNTRKILFTASLYIRCLPVETFYLLQVYTLDAKYLDIFLHIVSYHLEVLHVYNLGTFAPGFNIVTKSYWNNPCITHET